MAFKAEQISHYLQYFIKNRSGQACHCSVHLYTSDAVSLFFAGGRKFHLLLCRLLCGHLHPGHLRPPQWQHYAEEQWPHVPHWLWQIPGPRTDVWQHQKVRPGTSRGKICLHHFILDQHYIYSKQQNVLFPLSWKTLMCFNGLVKDAHSLCCLGIGLLSFLRLTWLTWLTGVTSLQVAFMTLWTCVVRHTTSSGNMHICSSTCWAWWDKNLIISVILSASG